MQARFFRLGHLKFLVGHRDAHCLNSCMASFLPAALTDRGCMDRILWDEREPEQCG